MMKNEHKTGQPITVTLRGEPLARVEAVTDTPKRVRLGALKGWIKINGDIVHSDSENDWEAR